jgi:hypothetical protein
MRPLERMLTVPPTVIANLRAVEPHFEQLRSNLERDFLHSNPRFELRSFWQAQGTQPPSSE